MSKVIKLIKEYSIPIVVCLILFTAITYAINGGKSEFKRAKKSEIKKLKATIGNMIVSNTYIQAEVDTDKFIAFIYNKNREAFAQTSTGGLSVYLNNDKAVIFGSNVTTGYDMSPLRLIERVLSMIDRGEATIKKARKNSDEKKTIDGEYYIVSISGIENVKKIYSEINDEYADEMIKQLYGETKAETSEFKVSLILGKNNEMAAICSMVLNGEEYKSWQFDGYRTMYDWELPQAWYSTEEKTASTWVTMMNALADVIEAKTKQYVKDNNIEVDKNLATSSETEDKSENHDHNNDGYDDHTGEKSEINTTEENSTANVNGEDTESISNQLMVNTNANFTTRSDWGKLDSEDKIKLVAEVIGVIKKEGKSVIKNENWFIQEIDNFYKNNQDNVTVGRVMLIVSAANGVIK